MTNNDNMHGDGGVTGPRLQAHHSRAHAEHGPPFLLTAIGVMVSALATAGLYAFTRLDGMFDDLSPMAPVAGIGIAFLVVISKGAGQKALLAATATSLIVGVSLALAPTWFDISFDGTHYHQDAILRMRSDFSLLGGFTPGPHSQFIDYYPKFSWYYAGAIRDLLGDVHLTKCINVQFLCAAMLAGLGAMRGMKPWMAVLAVASMLSNTTILAQLFTHYVDSLLGSSIAICIFGMMCTQQGDRLGPTIVWLGALSCASLKHTGAVSAVAICGVQVASIWWRRIGWQHVVSAKGASCILALAAVLLINPFATNIARGKHVFFPAVGQGKHETMMSGQISQAFYQQGHFVKLFTSMLGMTENVISEERPKPTLKVPFTITRRELAHVGWFDVRWGGWGPLFGGVFLTTCLLALWNWREVAKKFDIVALLCVMAFGNPEAWWARLNPQMHLLVALVLVLVAGGQGRTRTLAFAVMSLLVANGLLAFGFSIKVNAYWNRHTEDVIRKAADPNGVLWNYQLMRLDAIFDRLHIAWKPGTSKGDGEAIDLLGEKFYSAPPPLGR